MPTVPATTDVLQESEKLVIPEIRVWYKPIDGGGSDYEVFSTFTDALSVAGKNDADRKVVWEDVPLIAFGGYELNLWDMKPERN